MSRKFSVGFFIILAAIAILASTAANATVIGANRGVLDYRNVLKNGYAQELVTLTTDSDFNLSVDAKVEGDISEWLRLEPAEQPFFISKDKPYTVAVIVEPPEDARLEHYTGSIRFVTGAISGPEGQFGTAIRTAINIRLGVDVTGQQILSCAASEFRIDDVEEGYPIEFRAVFHNDGNVRLRPEFTLEFWNQDQTSIIETLNFTADRDFLPTTQNQVFKTLQHRLPIGQYWVKIKTPGCEGRGLGFLTMSVIERGGVSDKGELISIENNPWVKVGDIVPIDAVFQNLGTRVVSAKFKGLVVSGSRDNIFKIIETDSEDVMPGETIRLRTYFNPVQEGQYEVFGQVLYNRKLTFEKSSIINVNEAGREDSSSLFTQGNLVIGTLAVLIVLVFLIVRKKRSRSHIQG